MRSFFILCLLLPLLFEHAAGQGIASTTGARIKGKEDHHTPMSIQILDTMSTCKRLATAYDELSGDPNPNSQRQVYDTLRAFIESCANQSSVPPIGKPWHAFSYMTSPVYSMSNDQNRFLEFRAWLQKVLYLSVDTFYYCEDVLAQLSTFNYIVPGTEDGDNNGFVAVIDYVLDHNLCQYLRSILIEDRANIRKLQALRWQDTVQHPELTPQDTSVVSIDSIGFSILRGPEFGAVNPHTLHSDNFAELTASKNPFTDETILQTTLTDAAMLKLEIYDVLGKQLYSENQFFSSGEVKWKLDGKLLPQGSLYARVSMLGGLPKTIKLVKE